MSSRGHWGAQCTLHTPPQTQPQSVRYSVAAARSSASSLISSGSEANASDLKTIAFDFASRAAAASMPFVRLGNLPFLKIFCVNSDDISFFYGDEDQSSTVIVFKQPGRDELNVREVFSSVAGKLSATGGSH